MVIKTNSDYLAHHGILGQKWGERNGPPYPLGFKDYSVSEKKAKISYGSGTNNKKSVKEYKKELHAYTERQFSNDERVKSLRKEQDEIFDEAAAIAEKYELDGDDGGGGNKDKYSEEELNAASEKYIALWDTYGAIEDEIISIKKDYVKQGEQYIKDTYGDTAMTSIKAMEAAEIALGVSFVAAYLTAAVLQPVPTILATTIGVPAAVMTKIVIDEANKNGKKK